jgi:hypothetical protein
MKFFYDQKIVGGFRNIILYYLQAYQPFLGSSSYISLPVHSFAGPVAIHIHELANFLQNMKPELLAVYQLTKLHGCSIPANCCHPR